METVWLVKAMDTVWGNGSPGLDVETIISVCTSEEEADKVKEEATQSRLYDDIWKEKAKTNELID